MSKFIPNSKFHSVHEELIIQFINYERYNYIIYYREILLLNQDKKQKKMKINYGNSVLYHTVLVLVSITPVLQVSLDFFSDDSISFQHVLHFGVGKSQIEWKLNA